MNLYLKAYQVDRISMDKKDLKKVKIMLDNMIIYDRMII